MECLTNSRKNNLGNYGIISVLVNLMEKQEKQTSNRVFLNVSFCFLCICLLPGCPLAKHFAVTLYLTEENSHARYVFLTLLYRSGEGSSFTEDCGQTCDSCLTNSIVSCVLSKWNNLAEELGKFEVFGVITMVVAVIILIALATVAMMVALAEVLLVTSWID